MSSKVCTRCHVDKDYVWFDKHKLGKDGLNPVCKPCRANRQRLYRENFGYGALLKYRYGLSVEVYQQMLDSQNNRCAICHTEFSKDTNHKRKSVVDHNHSTGEVRGILCWSCNVALDCIKEDQTILSNMKEYIDAYRTG